MMVCSMCDPEGNPCDECKMQDDGDHYLWLEEQRLNNEGNKNE